ncbi:MAG TPA: cation diffusion facilitator family transporter [Flavipsychrobacter sp.]|nr:cation diffusion facilitator family transporter [Flavipsychrobacter sp.]
MHSHHDHSHGHSHHHGVATVANRAFVIGIILNSLYVIAEAIAGFITNSMALLSDAGHNLSDVAALALSLIAFRLAKVKPTQSFTYGYRKTTILAALTNAVVLLLAIGMLAYESIARLSHPEPVQGGIVAWVAGLGIAVNGISALFFFRDKEHDLNTKGAYLHLLTDALVSFAVVITGIVIKYTNWYWLDGTVSLAVLIIILIGTWSLLTDSLRLSLDAVPRNIDIDELTQVIKKVRGVEDLHHMHVWAMSTTENALTTHVVLDDGLDFDEKMKVIHNIKHELEHHNIQHATIELESAEAPCHDVDC